MRTKLLKRVRKEFSIEKIEKFNINEFKRNLSWKYYSSEYNKAKALYKLKMKNTYCMFLSFDEAYSQLVQEIHNKYIKSRKTEIRTKVWY